MNQAALRTAFFQVLAEEATNWGGGAAATDADPYLNQALQQICEKFPVFCVEKVLACVTNDVTVEHDDIIPVDPSGDNYDIIEIEGVDWKSTSNNNRYNLTRRAREDLEAKFTKAVRTPVNSVFAAQAAINEGGFAEFVLTAHELRDGDIITVDGSVAYDGDHIITRSNEANHVVTGTAYVAEVFLGAETYETPDPTPISISLIEYSYDPQYGLLVYPAVSGTGVLWVNWRAYLGDIGADGPDARYFPSTHHYYLVYLAAWLYMTSDADNRDDPIFQRIVQPHEARFAALMGKSRQKEIRRVGRFARVRGRTGSGR